MVTQFVISSTECSAVNWNISLGDTDFRAYGKLLSVKCRNGQNLGQEEDYWHPSHMVYDLVE